MDFENFPHFYILPICTKDLLSLNMTLEVMWQVGYY